MIAINWSGSDCCKHFGVLAAAPKQRSRKSVGEKFRRRLDGYSGAADDTDDWCRDAAGKLSFEASLNPVGSDRYDECAAICET